jgi:hypothetical protein
MRIVLWLWAVVGCCAVCPILQGFKTPLAPKQDRAWKSYQNLKWGYCVSYPSRWLKGDAFEGAGLYVETGDKKFSKPLGEIDVAVLLAPASSAAHAQNADLASDVETHFEVLKRFVRAEKVELLDKHGMELLGNRAIYAKDRYYDPQERATWLEELVLVNRKDALFRLELECRADHAARFEPVFARVLQTFRFDCEKQ